jgi:hypothetical protein
LDASYSQTGVKDKISQYWIQRLLDKAKAEHLIHLTDPNTRDSRLKGTALKGDERKAVKEEIMRRIQQELWEWLLRQPENNAVSDPNDGMI